MVLDPSLLHPCWRIYQSVLRSLHGMVLCGSVRRRLRLRLRLGLGLRLRLRLRLRQG
jgi:hypothetical protein